METEVHIIEKYLHEIKHWFTITNIKLKGGREIDLLALDPKTNRIYHIESRVTTTFPLRVKATLKSNGTDHKDGLDYFARVKFEPEVVTEFIQNITGLDNYRKVIVVLAISKIEEAAVFKEAKQMDIEIWKMQNIIKELGKLDMRGSRDDILRTLELAKYE